MLWIVFYIKLGLLGLELETTEYDVVTQSLFSPSQSPFIRFLGLGRNRKRTIFQRFFIRTKSFLDPSSYFRSCSIV